MKKLILGITLFSILSTSVFSQETHGNPNAWFLLLNQYKINENFSLGNETHLRFDDYLNDVQQFIIRPYFDYTGKNKNVVFSAGYSYIRTYAYGDFPIPATRPENNVWEQITLKQDFNKLNISHRYRFEQRFISKLVANSNNEFEAVGNTYGNRFRYRLTLKYKLNNKFFINVFDELWIKSSKGFVDADYDRNWIYTALGYNINKDASIQLAYLHQNIKNNPTRFEIHPGFQVTGSVNF